MLSLISILDNHKNRIQPGLSAMSEQTSILIVEDESVVALDTKNRLEHLGYQVTGIAASTTEAIRLVDKNRPDLVLMDIRLKGDTNGIRTAAILREKYDIPVVFVTAYADKDTLVQVKEAEPFGFITKPFDDKELYGVIETASNKWRTERKLKESELRFALAVQGTGVGLWDWYVQTGETVFNERWAEIAGYTLEELAPVNIQTWIDLCHPADLKRSNGLLKKHFAGATDFYECEIRMRHKQGHWVWVLDRGKVSEWDNKGKPVRMTGTHMDITEKKKTVMLLKTQRDLALALSAAKNLDDTLRICTQTAIDISEMDCGGVYLVKEKTGALDLVYHQGLSKAFIKQVSHYDADAPNAKIVMAGKPVYTHHKTLTEQIGVKSYEKLKAISVIPIRFQKKIIAAFNISSHTLDEMEEHSRVALEAIAAQIGEAIARSKAEEALRKSEEQLRMITENTMDNIAVCTFDARVTYLYVNPSIKPLMGYEPEDLIGKSFFDFVHPEDRLVLFPILKNYLIKKAGKLLSRKNGTVTETIEYRFRNKAGKWRFMQSTVNFAGNQLLAVTRDITERRTTLEMLQQSEARYRMLVDHASDNIYLIDMDGRFIDVNPAACDSLGRTKDELLSKSISDIDREWPEKKLKRFIKDLAAAKPATIEGTHRRKNKTTFPVEIRLTRVDAGDHSFVLALARDITERRRIEASLHQEPANGPTESSVCVSGIHIDWDRESGSCTFEKLPVAMMWIDTTLASVMSGLQAMVGTERFRLALQSDGRKSVEDDWRVISQFPDFKKGFNAIANIAAVAGWGDWKLIRMNKKRKQCIFQVSNSWEGLYQKSLGVSWGSGMLAGKLAGYCSMLFKTNCWADQTAFIARGDAYDEFSVRPSRRSIELEIENLLATDQASRADMAVALQKLQSEISIRRQAEKALHDSEERYRSIIENSGDAIYLLYNHKFEIINHKFEEMFGITPEEANGPDFNFMNLVAPESRPLIEDRMKRIARGENLDPRYEFTAVNTDGKKIRVETSVSYIKYKEGIASQGILRDVTERRRAEEHIKSSLKEKEILLKEVHHRVKNNLQIIRSLINMQKANADNDRFRMYATELSNRILTMSLIHEQLYATENFAAVNLEAYIETLVKRLAQSLIRHDVSIEKRIQNIQLGVDQSIPLGLVLNELLTNAIKHAFPKGREGKIGIVVEENEGYCEVIVRDNGIGLPKGTDIQQPTTLGLKLVHILTEQLGGTVDWKQRRGTSVNISFPLSKMNA